MLGKLGEYENSIFEDEFFSFQSDFVIANLYTAIKTPMDTDFYGLLTSEDIERIRELDYLISEERKKLYKELNDCCGVSINTIKDAMDFLKTKAPNEKCQILMKKLRYQILCESWVNKNRDISWIKKLEPCPCEITRKRKTSKGGLFTPDRHKDKYLVNGSEDSFKGKWALDINPLLDQYHPGAKLCIRSKPKPPKYHAQQCCYSIKKQKGNTIVFRLITEGGGAGTPDYISADYKPKKIYPWTETHITEDVHPFQNCKAGYGNELGLKIYIKIRQPNKGRVGSHCNPIVIEFKDD